jgi:DNA-binding transcriptional LysR family regulator
MGLDLIACMKCFVSVAECNGFSGAARKLRISTSVLTKQIQRLEVYLGKTLLERTTRYVALTEAGETYLRNAKKILGDVQAAKDEVIHLESDPHGKLIIGIPGAFNSAFYIKILKDFMKKYPKIILQTSADNSPSIILNGAADLVVSEENFSEPQLIKEKLLGIRRGLFASPEYLEENGTPKKTSDLKITIAY